MFKKITSLHIAIAVILLVVIVLNWSYLKSAVTGQKADAGGGSGVPDWIKKIWGNSDQPAIASNVQLDCSKVLKKGYTGAEVMQLQKWILQVDANALPNYGADGNFGQETLSALQKLTGASSLSLNTAQNLLNSKLKQLGMTWAIQSVC